MADLRTPDFQPFMNVGSVGLLLFFTVLGVFVLALPGRLDAILARAAGLGRHVEALIILGFISTMTFAGMGNVPIYFTERGVVAFSLVGAIVPTVLSLYFLYKAGWTRGVLALAAIGATSWVAFYVSRTEEGLGIVAEFPFFFLPSLTAAFLATLIAPGSIRAVPIAYAAGSLGGLIGADLVRFDWVLREAAAFGGSFGGADAMDLVSLAGLWAAAFAGVPLLPYYARLRQSRPAWERVGILAQEGRYQAALMQAQEILNDRLARWAQARGMKGAPPDVIRRQSFAEPVFQRLEEALWLGPSVDEATANPVLRDLEGLDRRLRDVIAAPAAPLGKRVGAAAIDLVVILVAVGAALAYVVPIDLVAVEDETAQALEDRSVLIKTIFVVWIAVATHVLYPLVTEWLSGGRTLGKALVGIRVRRTDGSRPSGWDYVVRNLGRLLDLPTFYLVPFAARKDTGRQRLGDYFAGTVVYDPKDAQTRNPVMNSPSASPASENPSVMATMRAPR